MVLFKRIKHVDHCIVRLEVKVQVYVAFLEEKFQGCDCRLVFVHGDAGGHNESYVCLLSFAS